MGINLRPQMPQETQEYPMIMSLGLPAADLLIYQFFHEGFSKKGLHDTIMWYKEEVRMVILFDVFI
jgi:hypothetical protein